MQKQLFLLILIIALVLSFLYFYLYSLKLSEKPPQTPTLPPPDETVKKFVTCYNARNYTCLHDLFSRNVTSLHTLNETKIKGKIVEWRIIKRDVVNHQKRILTINITLVCDGKLKGKTIKVPMKLEEGEFKIDSWILEVLKCG